MNMDRRELAGELLFLAFGLAFATYAAINYATGTAEFFAASENDRRTKVSLIVMQSLLDTRK